MNNLNLKFNYVNPNTEEKTVCFLEKLFSEIAYTNLALQK